MDEQVWTFTRGEEHLELRRNAATDGFLLGVVGDGTPRSYHFAELEKLEQFQADFEKFLVATGWGLITFAPERRAGRERRHFSRLLTDRRRWWTDGVDAPVEHDQDERELRLRRIRRHHN